MAWKKIATATFFGAMLLSYHLYLAKKYPASSAALERPSAPLHAAMENPKDQPTSSEAGSARAEDAATNEIETDQASSQNRGFFAVLSAPLLVVLTYLKGLLQNWGLAIIALTLIIKLLTYPLNRYAFIAQGKVTRLQPQLQRIKEQYADDKKRQHEETSLLMAREGVNPATACLPLLLQVLPLPIFLAFYNLLSSAAVLHHAPFYGWITDLSLADPLYVAPILMGIIALLQQKVSSGAALTDDRAKMIKVMPLIFAAMVISLPAGMALYMLTNSLLSVFQQLWLTRCVATR